MVKVVLNIKLRNEDEAKKMNEKLNGILPPGYFTKLDIDPSRSYVDPKITIYHREKRFFKKYKKIGDVTFSPYSDPIMPSVNIEVRDDIVKDCLETVLRDYETEGRETKITLNYRP